MNQSNRPAVERIVKQANHMLNDTDFYRDTLARDAIMSLTNGTLSALRALGHTRVGVTTAAQEMDRWVGYVRNTAGTYDLDSVPLSEPGVTVAGFLDGLQAGGTTNMVDDR